MRTTPNLFPKFMPAVCQLSLSQIDDPRAAPHLLLDREVVGGREIEMVYAPFDHVNRKARLVIVGLTPGKQQAANALRAAHAALKAGLSNDEAAERAKVFASFSGPMRANLVSMLDSVGIARWLRLDTTASLWAQDAQLIQFTSALRYPVFVDGQNWSGSPDMIKNASMRRWLEVYTGSELALLDDAVFVPLGSKVAAGLRHLAALGAISTDRILDGLPHPSGANAERIAYFIGSKPADRLSTKTNPVMIDAARAMLCDKVSKLRL
ncbi:hypothetical protein KCP91_16285 [Microvirga sp. SRT01]|uniref:Uracil DNA glycosylase superfamily protein n=1 Tax=Sphingomonas longa TaxID=2778730 RepID=A0ABS2DAH7_9SPHN|nr:MULTISPECIES: hypothetical protein [Alphaproteobacteria]MBM6577944.1 hypothetical protein [Sphingomonas sp. BT552]MBR7710985.1 hypothetical protein [Microvirga sp. SRT01]